MIYMQSIAVPWYLSYWCTHISAASEVLALARSCRTHTYTTETQWHSASVNTGRLCPELSFLPLSLLAWPVFLLNMNHLAEIPEWQLRLLCWPWSSGSHGLKLRCKVYSGIVLFALVIVSQHGFCFLRGLMLLILGVSCWCVIGRC